MLIGFWGCCELTIFMQRGATTTTKNEQVLSALVTDAGPSAPPAPTCHAARACRRAGRGGAG
jgi:hypothetical protein